VKCGNRSPNDLYISVTDTTFGDPSACTGPTTQLT
jgi:hypothetical protein